MVRQSRTQESREAESVHEEYNDNWENPSLLDTKNIPVRKGYVQRWIRTKTRGKDDEANVFRKSNQGWKVRLLSSVPKGSFVPKIDFNGVDVIGIHGMILMERPEKQHEAQGRYVKKTTNNLMANVDKNMFNVHSEGSGMTRPSANNNSSITQGKQLEFDED